MLVDARHELRVAIAHRARMGIVAGCGSHVVSVAQTESVRDKARCRTAREQSWFYGVDPKFDGLSKSSITTGNRAIYR